MSTELTVLTYAALLQVLQFCLVSVFANLELGTKVTMAPRDGTSLADQLSPRSGRLYRALNNHFEGLILFTIAVVVVTLGEQSTPLTQTCAWVYLAARILYITAYTFGWVPWRSVIWCIGFGATVLMLLAALV
ncbi:MAG: MAPEG family protein [Roseobacter sp.]